MSDTPMVERETMSGLRERIARGLAVLHEVATEEVDASYGVDLLTLYHDVSRALRVMEQEPVAWKIVVRNRDGSMNRELVRIDYEDAEQDAKRWRHPVLRPSVTLVPLVALPTEDPEDG